MRKVYIIAGPTASGKTALAVSLAKRLNGEVVSADSMQIYREMRIGTALPTEKEKEGIPHHMLEIVSPDVKFSVAMYQEQAFTAINEILSRGKTPIVAGGTGLYINSLTYRLNFTNTIENPEFRAELSLRYDESPKTVYEELLEKDPECAERIHQNDKLRIIRRLEILNFSPDTPEYDFRQPNTDYDFGMFALTRERPLLYDGINQRVDSMANEGLSEEVRQVYEKYGSEITAFSAIGYKEFLPYFENTCTETEVYEKIKQNTRRFAKRQLTWFRRDPRFHWLNPDDFADRTAMTDYIIQNWS